ncbi:hypothetical protein BC827DRAFT_1236078 [Russula dissimulans]|nr:hypothetical protein BC827DRAFT_1236078 [Russula dissimulans]
MMWQHAARCSTRHLSSLHSRLPWFIDPSEASFAPQTPSQRGTVPPLPSGVPIALRNLHAQLVQSPYLDPSKLLVRDPILQPPGPPLPISTPRGRRKRGGTLAGEGLLEPGNLWNWIVLAQVKEGTEKRGSIESLVRIVRKALLSVDPPLELPRKARREIHDGWAMVDAGEFAVHILSAQARERYFGDRSLW